MIDELSNVDKRKKLRERLQGIFVAWAHEDDYGLSDHELVLATIERYYWHHRQYIIDVNG